MARLPRSASILYVAFDSMASLCPEQMAEIAEGLYDSDKPFLWVWVVRSKEASKLPYGFTAKLVKKARLGGGGAGGPLGGASGSSCAMAVAHSAGAQGLLVVAAVSMVGAHS